MGVALKPSSLTKTTMKNNSVCIGNHRNNKKYNENNVSGMEIIGFKENNNKDHGFCSDIIKKN